ncbi:MAG: hypothetical protein IT324_17715 [Anaerolineae bacterium]|nr:hypothetical protein [Anaerolineae bacterium]
MRFRVIVLALVLIAIVLPLPMHGDNGDCSGAPPIRLATGTTARVMFRNVAGSVLRENPGERFRRVATLRSGSLVYIASGPTCADSTQWWQVQTINGVLGWLSEGDETAYQIEPWAASLDVPRRTAAGVDLLRIKANDAVGSRVGVFPLNPVNGSAPAVFPSSEWRSLEAILTDDLARCPAVLQAVADIRTAPVDTRSFDVYPSPDGKQLITVHHLWRGLPTCTATSSPLYGLDRVSLTTAGVERTVLYIPANDSAPLYLDHFNYRPQDAANNRVEGVWWSPDNTRAIFLIRYADLRDASAPTFLFKMQVYDVSTDSLIDLGDGLHPAWDVTGERVQWFRRVNARPGAPTAEVLYTANANGSDLRSIPLPDDLTFTPPQPYTQPVLPWNDSGKRVIGCAASGNNGCTAVAAFDLAERKVTLPITIDPALQHNGYRAVKWLDDYTLLWLPADPALMTLYAQNILTGDVRPIRFKAGANVRLLLDDAQPFMDGKSVLVTLRNAEGSRSYVVVNVEAATVTAVRLP